MARKNPDGFVVFPGTVLVDTREQAPFGFAGLRADAKDNHVPIVIRTEVRGLPTGDYSLAGFEGNGVAVERKSLADLYQTLTRGRDRFERELDRLAGFDSSAVVVEADWQEILERPPPGTVVPPKVIHRSVIAFSQRFPKTHWFLMPGRAVAEATCFRFLERYYLDHEGVGDGRTERVERRGEANS